MFSSSTVSGRLRHRARAVATSSMVAISLLTLTTGTSVSAHTTIVFDDAGESAPDIGLVGDSTLSGVRWYASYGELREYNFVFDAESCRRTLETSCWSREGYRPENAVGALQRLRGQWGDVLVVMSGYNDSSYLFDDAVEAVVDEARRQDIPHVIWLTLRTADDVDYEEPQHQANANTYRESNRMLFEKAAEYGGYLQIADWATYSDDESDWFSYDGVHLSDEGVSGVTSYIADQVARVLDGETITAEHPAWVTLEPGDSGNTVSSAQEALLAAGFTSVLGADGVFGEHTADAVAEFQAARGLAGTGTVDERTAVALGLHERVARPLVTPAAPPVSTPQRALEPAPEAVAAPPTAAVSSTSPDRRVVAAVAAAAALILLVVVVRGRRRLRRRRDSPPAVTEAAWAPIDRSRDDLLFPVVMPALYDYEQEDALVP